MNNRPAYKILSVTFGLTLLTGSVMADTQAQNPFVSSASTAETITVAFRGKPPYRNRPQYMAKLRAQQTARASTEELEEIEMSALEPTEKEGQSPVSRKSTRKKFGHPYHR